MKINAIEYLPLEQQLLLTLVRWAVSPAVSRAEMLSVVHNCGIDWWKVYHEAVRQNVIGLSFAGVEKLHAELMNTMDINLKMEWFGQTRLIMAQNESCTNAAKEAVRHFRDHRIDCVILKGQGLARLYIDPRTRTSGDIDLFVISKKRKEPSEAFIKGVTSLAAANAGLAEKNFYHHCDFGQIAGTPVEAHWRASWFYCPWYNRRFQQWSFRQILASTDVVTEDNELPVPSLAFDRIFVLVHIYRHLFGEGIGLKQLVDYYMVLQHSFENELLAHQEKIATMQVLKRLGMARFTAAVMWIMNEVLGLSASKLLCEPNEVDGRFLLNEVMMSGNFGHHDSRYCRHEEDTFLQYALRKFKRNMGMWRFGAIEVLWTPLWRAWHVGWWMRKYN